MLEIQLGNKTKELRLLADLSQQQLSEKTGISREQISKIENGQCNCTLDTVERLARALKVEPKVFFELPPLPFSASNSENKKLKPFVKWAGGKTQVIDKIIPLLPKEFERYFEPFAGGGALFFSMAPHHATINDFNEELVDVYRCLKSNEYYYSLIYSLEEHERNHNEEYYLKIRKMDRNPNFATLPPYVRAARMVYLNKACFNGLYRVNSKGFFNVPSGKKERVVCFDRENLKAIHSYFMESDIRILCGDFGNAVKDAKAGDFVYFDPPYDVYKDDGFTSYTGLGFGKEEQKRLAMVFEELSSKGVKCLLSNHNTPFINELYKKYKITVIQAKRMINSDASGRGNVEEVLISNY